MSVGLPFSQITAARAVCLPTAWSQLPEMPATSPLSLIAVAEPEVSPESGGSSWIWFFPGPQMTALNWRTCGATHPFVSRTEVSAHPTTCPTLLATAAKPLLPPSVGSFLILPSSHTNPRQIKPILSGPGKKIRELHSSPNGSRSAVWAIPTIIPLLFFTGHITALFGPPSVPRGNSSPSRHKVACRLVLLDSLEKPVTQPRL